MTTHAVYMLQRRNADKPYFAGSAPTGQPVSLPRSVRLGDKLIICGTHHAEDVAAFYVQSLKIEHKIKDAALYKRTPIRCLTDNTTHASAAAACKAYGISPATMSLHLNNPSRFNTANGWIFQRIQENP